MSGNKIQHVLHCSGVAHSYRGGGSLYMYISHGHCALIEQCQSRGSMIMFPASVDPDPALIYGYLRLATPWDGVFSLSAVLST